MQTTNENTTTEINKNLIAPAEDVVRRGIKRDLYCKLEDIELLRIARARATKEAERDQLVDDMARETKKRKEQISELDDAITKMGRELRTGEQERTVPCNDVFRRALDGTGWIHTIRLDTWDEVERRPATAHETQRYLPNVDAGAGILDEARAKQQKRSAQDDVPSGETTEADPDLPPDDGEGEGEPNSPGLPDAKGRKKNGKAK